MKNVISAVREADDLPDLRVIDRQRTLHDLVRFRMIRRTTN